MGLPEKYRKRLHRTNMQERLNEEVRHITHGRHPAPLPEKTTTSSPSRVKTQTSLTGSGQIYSKFWT